MNRTDVNGQKIVSSIEGDDGKGVIAEVVKQEKQDEDNTEYHDLCVTCNNATICTSRKNFKRPVWFCEEFDDYVPPSDRTTAPNLSSFSDIESSSKSEEEISTVYKGLCLNCVKRRSCKFPKPEGGIWHCEEYE